MPTEFPEKNILSRLDNSFKVLTNYLNGPGLEPGSFTIIHYDHPTNRPVNSMYYPFLKALGDYLEVKFMWTYKVRRLDSNYGMKGIRIFGREELVRIAEYILTHIFIQLESYKYSFKNKIPTATIGELYWEKLSAITFLISKAKKHRSLNPGDTKVQEKIIFEKVRLDLKKYHTTSITYAMATSRSFHHQRMVN
jgi:hypothetical protein